MKNKLNRKLITVNSMILVIALSVFCIVVSVILKNYMNESLGEQLLIENKSVHRVALLRNRTNLEVVDKISSKPWMFDNLTESTSMVFVWNEKMSAYELTSINNEDFKAPADIIALMREMSKQDDEVVHIVLNGKTYLATMSEVSNVRNLDIPKSIAISLVPLDSVQNLIAKYIAALILIIILLGGISIVVMQRFSKKITDPINTVTALTRQYAKQDFSERFIAHTGDEIEELSIAVDEMASSLKRHDEEQVKFFRHVSHEMKTPLTSIYGYAEGLKSGVFTNQDEVLDIIMNESLRIKKLTEDIIFLSKLESNIEVYDFQECHVGEVIEDAIRSVESIAILKDIDIFYEPHPTKALELDYDKIYRAIVNLLSNCIKYTKDLVEIKVLETEGELQIIIADNGKGFDEASLRNLTNGLAKEKSDGSGIGLSIVAEILKRHHGSLSILNRRENSGAVFEMHLPKSSLQNKTLE